MGALYNDSNLDFTGQYNPYGLIQQAGKRSKKQSKKRTKKGTKRKTRKNTRRTRRSRK